MNFPSLFTNVAVIKGPSATNGNSHRVCSTPLLKRSEATGKFSRESAGRKAIPSRLRKIWRGGVADHFCRSFVRAPPETLRRTRPPTDRLHHHLSTTTNRPDPVSIHLASFFGNPATPVTPASTVSTSGQPRRAASMARTSIISNSSDMLRALQKAKMLPELKLKL